MPLISEAGVPGAGFGARETGERGSRVSQHSAHACGSAIGRAILHTHKQGDAVADGEEADIQRNILEAIQEKDDAGEKQQMMVSRHHVLDAEIHIRNELPAGHAFEVLGVAFGYTVGKHWYRHEAQQQTADNNDASIKSLVYG